MADLDNKTYIQFKVHPIYERMLVDILNKKPDDLVLN